ncbi:MAG: hypothetical protein A3I66_12705 [Burkholderiales bacterium RIFCSPLOWO2_02_FULL_57_36]|nr:MAG: hypothetical protein A3I66_12705 [Burkholderiales bacterium RIFCSPLOWO2_02_FULL_57_36]
MQADLDKSDFKRSFEANMGSFEVNVNDASEVRRWVQHWNISEAELRRTVAAVGTEVDAVRIALGK